MNLILLPVAIWVVGGLWAFNEIAILLLQDYLPLVTTPLSWFATLPDLPMSLPFIAMWALATAWRYATGGQKLEVGWGLLLHLFFAALVLANFLVVAEHTEYAQSKTFLLLTINLFSYIGGATFARPQVPRVLRAIAVLGLVVTALTYQAYGQGHETMPGRYSSWDMNPIWTCRLALLGAFTAFATFKKQRWAWAYLVAIAPAVWLTGSRGPMLAAVIAALGMGVVWWLSPKVEAAPATPRHRRPGGHTPRWKAAAIAIAIGLGTVSGVVMGPAHPAHAAQETRDLGDTETVSSRAFLYGRALQGFADHFLLGVGVGGFEGLVSQAETGEKIIFPHNAFLEVAAEFGIVGLLTFLAMVGHFLWLSARHLRFARAHQGDPSATWGVAATAGFLNLFAAAQFSGDLVSNHAMFFFMGLMTGVATLRATTTEATARVPKARRRFA